MIAPNNSRNEQENISEGPKKNSDFGLVVNSQYKRIEPQESEYQCPMNCEGNKTYNQPGECPVCNMRLVIVGIDEPKIHVE
jgi:hypothetical protein